jgi:hypothetical protein
VALAVETGTLPAQWFDELDRDERVVATALDILTQAAERQTGSRATRTGDGRQMSG